MSTLSIELILWMLLAFFIGCIIGCLLFGIFDGMRRRALAMAAAEAPPGPHQWSLPPAEHAGSAAPASTQPARPGMGDEAATVPAPMPQAAEQGGGPATGKPRQPQALSRPPEGDGDDLKRISGVGPAIEGTLHQLGIYYYRQIAAWTADEVDWVDERLNFHGRIAREEWIVQARLLASGDEEAFARQFGSGGLTDASGHTHSGSHTRR